MHFITGGAFNGKRSWVSKQYCNGRSFKWISAYENNCPPTNLSTIDEPFIILEGIELWLKELSKEYDSHQCRLKWNDYIDMWCSWESAKDGRTLIIMGTDITKGIVPIEKENRIWRDATGWAYQDTIKKANKVELIWYGINKNLK